MPGINYGERHNIIKRNLSDLNEVLWANMIYDRSDIKWYSKFNRFGALDPYNAVSGSKEYVFFTKPDLHIVEPGSATLNPELSNQPYFSELLNRYPDVISQLQKSAKIGNDGPFMALLSNGLKNTLEIQSVSASTIEIPSNIYGTTYNYRGWGYNSDEKVEFQLEFEDSKYLEIYNLIKAYEEYERLKHIGMVTPPNLYGGFNYYIKNKILHDQFSVYKFIVEDDGESIMYYAKLWGVFFKNVPRDAFSDMKVEGGLSYAVEFEAAFIDDMNPTILGDFNTLTFQSINDTYTEELPIYNSNIDAVDGRWAAIPHIVKSYRGSNSASWAGPSKMQYTYKLKWRV